VVIHLSGCTYKKTRHIWLRTIKFDPIPLYILSRVEDGILLRTHGYVLVAGKRNILEITVQENAQKNTVVYELCRCNNT